MKLESLLIGHAMFSGAGTLGSGLALRATRIDLLWLPLAVALSMLVLDCLLLRELFFVRKKNHG